MSCKLMPCDQVIARCKYLLLVLYTYYIRIIHMTNNIVIHMMYKTNPTASN